MGKLQAAATKGKINIRDAKAEKRRTVENRPREGKITVGDGAKAT